ncbi:hypothetical protein [Empedobacter brevis]|uniref:hypothetical protein n=1 Tax=Empedobacter brevis TaxID=247 RepID=UPI002FE08465
MKKENLIILILIPFFFFYCKKEKCSNSIQYEIGDRNSYYYRSISSYLYFFNEKEQRQDSIYINLSCKDIKEIDNKLNELSKINVSHDYKLKDLQNITVTSGNPFSYYIILKDGNKRRYEITKKEYYNNVYNQEDANHLKNVYQYILREKILKDDIVRKTLEEKAW